MNTNENIEEPKRQIQCARCNYCCTHISFFYPNSEEAMEWIKARGLIINQQSDKQIEVIMQHKCQNYVHNKGCKIQNNNKPVACIMFPMNMIDTLKDAGLNFNKFVGKRCAFREEE